MVNSRCLSYKRRYILSIVLVSLCIIFGFALFIAGGVTYSSDSYAKAIHEPKSCKDSVTENYTHATIEHDGFQRPAAAEAKLNHYQIGMSYSCWCNVVNPSKARWEEPSIFVGMMLLIVGGVSTILCLVGIYVTYRIRRILKSENEQFSVEQ